MIIGICAKAQNGKSEFTKLAVEEFNAIQSPFAGQLKIEVAEFLKENNIPFENKNLYGSGSDKEELFNFHHFNNKEIDYLIEPYVKFINGAKYCSFRSLLQIWGTEYRRSKNPNYWIDKNLNNCPNNKLVCIDDCRFLNEAKAIKDKGGYLVKIIRSDAPIISNMTHASEIELEQIVPDFIIYNNGTLDTYHAKCRRILNHILFGN